MFLAIQGHIAATISAVQPYLELRLASRDYKASIRRGDARGAYEAAVRRRYRPMSGLPSADLRRAPS